MTYPRETPTTPVAVGPTAELVAAWDVRDTVVLALQVKNTGAEAVTPTLFSRLAPSLDWGLSPLTFNTPDGSGVLQPGETGRVDIDVGAQLEVGLFLECPLVASTADVTGRSDGGKRR